MGSRAVQRIATEIARCEQAEGFWKMTGDLELAGYYRGAAEAYRSIVFDSDLTVEEVRQILELARMQQVLQMGGSLLGEEERRGTAGVGS